MLYNNEFLFLFHHYYIYILYIYSKKKEYKDFNVMHNKGLTNVC